MWREPCSLGLLSPPAGASPLGEMPSIDEVAALGIASAGAGEDPLSSVETSRESRAIPGLPDALSTSGHPAGKHSASASGTASSQGFSLGHGFPLIPAKMVRNGEYVRVASRQSGVSSSIS